jgi:hypothetical protein
MKSTVAIVTGALLVLVFGGALQAHHSGSMYSTTPVRLEGTVVRFEPINPHTLMTVEQRSDDGQVSQWVVEGPGQSQLDRIGPRIDVPQIGDSVKFCAFPYKPAEELARLFPDADFSSPRFSPEADGSSPRFVVGHVMETVDGDKQLWEPHGMIGECIRDSDEERQVWVNFINSSARVRDAWCQQTAYTHVRATESLAELVDAVNGSIDDPC